MDLGIVGLGRMGANMARRLMGDGHRIENRIDGGAIVGAPLGQAADAGAVGGRVSVSQGSDPVKMPLSPGKLA